ncbi:MAG: hypothetical protein HY903_02100 [Deltaproteobacteria bacterium]|nr:hypothetical protein [Deltaproteobacteria bacterium]
MRRKRRRSRRLGALLWLSLGLSLWAAACDVQTTLPDNVRVSCSQDADCPDGFRCRPATGLCASRAGDLQAPAIVDGSVSFGPTPAAPGRTVELRFTASEPLFSLPAVHLAGESEPWRGADEGGSTFSFTYVEPAQGADRTVPVVVTLVDLSGNVSSDVSVGASLTLDHSLPALTGDPSVTPSRLRPTAAFGVEITATEVLAAAPALTLILADGTPVVLTYRSDDGALTYTYDGILPPDAANGPARLEVLLEDVAGNLGTTDRHDLVAVDSELPGIAPGSLSLDMVAPDTGLLGNVSRAASGTDVIARFSVTEPLGALPLVTAAGLVRPVVSAGEASYVATVAVGTLTPDGTMAIHATLTDVAGNVADLDIASVVVDNSGPPLPDVDSLTALVHRRALRDATAARKDRHQLIGAAGAVSVEAHEPQEDPFVGPNGKPPPAALLLVFGDSGADAIEIGRVWVEADGSFPAIELPPSDLEAVYVVAVDRAGNPSGAAGGDRTLHPVRVRNGVLVVGMRGNILPELGRVYESRALLAGRTQGPGAPLNQTAWAAADGDTHPTLTGPSFLRLPTAQPLPPLSGTAAAYDEGRDRVVVFGGASGTAATRDTWELTPTGWVQRAPAHAPAARLDHVMAYFPGRGVVLHGGCGLSTPGPCAAPLDDLAVWDGTDWKCLDGSDLPCAIASGVADRDHVMVYDPFGPRLVLITSGGATYRLGIAADAWIAMSPAGSGPTHGGASATFVPFDNPNPRAVIVFGGSGCNGLPCAATYQLDLSGGGAWSDLTPVAPALSPQGRSGARLVYDPRTRRVLLFGGLVDETPGEPSCDGSGASICRSVWAFDRSQGTWRRVEIDDPEGDGDAPARHRFAAVADTLRNRTVVLGGLGTAGTNLADTWAYAAQSDGRPAQIYEVRLAAAGTELANRLTFGIDFQASESTPAAGYTADTGEPYPVQRDDLIYGWDLDQTATARDRDSPFAPDDRVDSSNTLNTGLASRLWEIDVPTGQWGVYVGYGDGLAGSAPAPICLRAEGGLVADDVMTLAHRFGAREAAVRVTDGRLSLDSGCPGPLESRIGFVDLWPETTLVEALTVEWIAGARGQNLDPPVHAVVLDHVAIGSGAVIPVPDLVSAAAPRSANRRWSLRFVLDAGAAGTDAWTACLVINGAPSCAAAVAVEPGAEAVATIDLAGAALAPITSFGVQVSFATFFDGSWELWGDPTQPGTVNVDGTALWALAPAGWELLATNNAPLSAPAGLGVAAASAATWAAGSPSGVTTTDGPTISRLIYGPDNTLRFAATPVGVMGFSPDYARVASDWARVTVRYRLSGP